MDPVAFANILGLITAADKTLAGVLTVARQARADLSSDQIGQLDAHLATLESRNDVDFARIDAKAAAAEQQV